MDYEITREQANPYYLIRLTGAFDLQDLEKCYVKLINHPQWQPNTNVIWDARECTFEHLKGEDLNRVGTMTLKYSKKRGKGKAAWVVGREIDFAISRMFAMFNEDRVVFSFRVFRELDAARKFACEPLESS